MRIYILALLAIPAASMAQTNIQPLAPPPQTRPLPPDTLEPDTQTTPLAAKGGNRVLSENELYNIARAKEGRVGARLGNDMRYRVTGN